MRKVLFSLAALACAFGAGASGGEQSGAFKVIVNPKVAGRAISRTALVQIYLGKARAWGDGHPIAAVDLSSTSPVRAAFSEAILGMPVAGVQAHWLRSINTGGSRPPVTKRADEDVIAFVASEPGGVGYVAEATAVPETVKAVVVQ